MTALPPPIDRDAEETPEPHTIVEEIKEEIAQVVEHVPKPVRWTVRKLALLIGFSIVALVVIAVASVLLYFANRTEVLAKELVLFVNGTLAQRSDVRLEFQDIRGNPLHEIRLINARVRFRDDKGPVLLEVPSVRLRYSAWGLVSGRGRAIEIDLDRPVFRLGRRPDGTLRLPEWKAGGKPPKADASAITVRVGLNSGTLEAPEPLNGIDGLDLAAGIEIGKGTRVRVERLHWQHGFYDTRDLLLQGEMVAGDSVLFRIDRVQTPDFSLIARGGWKKGNRARVVHAEVEGLNWRWLAGVTKNHTLDVPGEGHAIVDASCDSTLWQGRFEANVDWNLEHATGGGGFAWSGRELVLEPLRAQSKAGDLDGRLTWSKLGWQIGGHVVDGDPAHWAAINIPGWPAGRLQGDMLYKVDTRHAPVARLDATLGPSELAEWNADRAFVTVLFPSVGPDSFTVNMERRGGRMQLQGAAADGAWTGHYVAENLPLEEWPDGRKGGIKGILDRAEGTVSGRSGALDVTGDLSGHSSDWLGASIARWKLTSLQGRLLPTPDLTAMASLRDMNYLTIPFDSTTIDLHLLDGAAELTSVSGWAGDTLVTLAGRAEWSANGLWSVSFDRARMQSRQFDWTADPPMRFSGDPTGVVFDRLRASDQAARLEITGRWATPPHGRYDWRMRATGLDLSRIGMPPELGLVGTLDGTLDVRGVSGDPRWSFEGAFSKPGWQGHRADSLTLSLSGAPSTLDVHRAWFALAGGSLDAHGLFENMDRAWPDTLVADGIVRWLANAGRWSGEATAKALPLDRLERLAPKAKGLIGQLAAHVTFAGSPSRPELDASADVEGLGWEGYRVDAMKTRARYRPDRLEVSQLELSRANLKSTASGSMALVLRMAEKPTLPEEPMSWRIEIPNGDLSVLPLFVQQFGSAAGKFELSASIEGTPQHPELGGYLRARDGRLRMAGREETLEKVSADIRLDESRITLDSLTASQGVRGRVFASGAVELSNAGLKSYAFDVRLREFTSLETGLYAAQFDGDFKVTDGLRVHGQIIPHVEGHAAMRHAVILFDFANQSEVQRIAATTQPLFWTYRIQVDANNNLHWQPPDGDIELNANLNLEQTANDLIIYGEMHEIRGYYWFLSNRFNVTQADLTFDNAEGGVNPQIDAIATTRLAPFDTVTTAHDVTVHITGRSNEPHIEFASDPGDWDEDQVLRELTLVAPVTRNGTVNVGALGDPVENYLTRAINRTLSAEMSRVFQGYISEWELRRETGGILGGTGDVYVSVGGQLTPQLAWRYRQRVPGLGRENATTTSTSTSITTNPFERDVEAEYRLNRFFYVSSEVAQRRILTSTQSPTSTGMDFNLNLKARWEY